MGRGLCAVTIFGYQSLGARPCGAYYASLHPPENMGVNYLQYPRTAWAILNSVIQRHFIFMPSGNLILNE